MNVYENIDRILKEKRMSRRRLARLAGIKETTLAACFARRPEHFPLKYALAIADVLDVNVEELYGHSIDVTPQMVDIPTKIHYIPPEDRRDEFIIKQVISMNDEDKREQMLLEIFDMLNPKGQNELIKRAFEMSQIREYMRKEE